MILNSIPNDKLLHFFYSTILSFIFINIHIWYGFIFVILILLGKELIWDKLMKRGTPELKDFIYGAIPAVMILITKLNLFTL